MPAYYLMVVAMVGLVTGLKMRETANQPLRGATPATSNRREAKEILSDHFDSIEQKVEDIDEQIENLQEQRQDLVDQHPKLD